MDWNGRISWAETKRLFTEERMSLTKLEKVTGIGRHIIALHLRNERIDSFANRGYGNIADIKEESIIKTAFLNGKTIKEIALSTGRQRHTVKAILLRVGMKNEKIASLCRKNFLAKMRNCYPFPEELLKELYNKGLTMNAALKEIKKSTGIFHTLKIAKDYAKLWELDFEQNYEKWLVEKRSVKKEKQVRIAKLFEEGYSPAEIGKKLKLESTTIKTYLNKWGFDTGLSWRFFAQGFNESDHEKKAKCILEKEGWKVIRCAFLCWRQKLTKRNILVPKELKENYCSRCPCKNIEPRGGNNFFDYAVFNDTKVAVLEVKSKIKDREPQYTAGQAINGMLLAKAGIPIFNFIYRGDKLERIEI